MKIMILILSLVAVVGCSRQQATAATQTQKLPTATEVFNLRSKCAELGKRLDESMGHVSAVAQDMVSNYNVKNNRCYVKLTNHPTNYAEITTKSWFNNVYLFDGQTREALATTSTTGNEFDGSTKKSGMAYGKNIRTYDAAEAYIDRLMEREGE